MKLVFGLGNPGKTYDGTRHNVGFEVIDRVCSRVKASAECKKHHGIVREALLGTEKVWFVKPQTFMNLSGNCIRETVGFFRVDPKEVLIVTDDVSLSLGRLRARARGTHGGHNGLRSIQDALQTTDYSRLRIGVDAAGEKDLADHVLGRFRPSEKETIQAALERAADAVECWLREGIEPCMNRYNPAETGK